MFDPIIRSYDVELVDAENVRRYWFHPTDALALARVTALLVQDPNRIVNLKCGEDPKIDETTQLRTVRTVYILL